MVTFLHSADWHLGMTRAFLGAESQALYAEARLEAVRAMARLADDTGCAFAVVCGDVFDSNHLDRAVVVRLLEALRAFTVPVLLLPGNHDALTAASVYRSRELTEALPGDVRVLDGSAPVVLADGTVEVVGAPLLSRAPVDDLLGAALAGLGPREPGRVRIVAAHGVVDELSPDAGDPAVLSVAAAEQAVAAGLVDYIALGDRHSTTPVGSSGRIWYSGSPLVTDFRDLDPGNALVVEVAGPGAAPVVTPHRVGRWVLLARHFLVSQPEDVEAFGAELDAMPDKHMTVLKLSFEGTLTLAAKARLDELLEHHSSLFAALDPWERHTDLHVRHGAGDLDALGLTGFAAAALADVSERAAAGGDAAATAEDALNLLFRLAR